MNVLAVDDDKVGKFLYDALGKRYCFDVTTVNCCDEAVAACRMLQFDVILMDWVLRGNNGLQCAKLLRQQQRELGRYIPIIAVTAHAMEQHRRECLKAGMDDYLSKPFEAEELFAMMQKWVNRATLQCTQEQTG
ncbi:MAG: response regulator [Candidatus Obscuribacterales bacterium]|nr:response regulator [Candidatus Obscuribacterales bacterium]